MTEINLEELRKLVSQENEEYENKIKDLKNIIENLNARIILLTKTLDDECALCKNNDICKRLEQEQNKIKKISKLLAKKYNDLREYELYKDIVNIIHGISPLYSMEIEE